MRYLVNGLMFGVGLLLVQLAQGVPFYQLPGWGLAAVALLDLVLGPRASRAGRLAVPGLLLAVAALLVCQGWLFFAPLHGGLGVGFGLLGVVRLLRADRPRKPA